MKDYITGKCVCRREALLQHFDHVSSKPSGHMCCDRCAETCTCKETYCDVNVYLQVGDVCDNMDVASPSRHVSDKQVEELKRRLWQMRLEREVGE
jgi:hypothetical protein